MTRTIGLALVFVSLVAAGGGTTMLYSDGTFGPAALVNEVSTLSEIPSQNDCRVIAAKPVVETPTNKLFLLESTDGAYVTVSEVQYETLSVGDTYCGNWTTSRS